MPEENEKQAEVNGASADGFDIPTIGGNNKREKKRGFLGLSSGSGAQAAGVATRSGPLGLVFNNIGILFKLAPLMGTMVMGLAMPAYNQARNKAIYQDAIHRAQLLKSAAALPSDEAVDKMRQNTNLDNESLIRAKNACAGMKFGDDAPPPEQNQDGSAAAKPADAAADAGTVDPAAAAAAAKSAADGAKTAEALNKSAFGKSEFGNSSPFGNSGGGSGGGAGFGTQITNYAPESKFGSIKKGAKGQIGGAMAKGKGVGLGRDGRTLGVGKRGKGFGQLKMAAMYSKKATGARNQASAALAGKAFDSGTMSADNSVRGVAGEGVGTGAGVGEGDADQAAANAQMAGIQTPKVAAVAVPKNDSCEGANKDAMKPPSGPMTEDEHKKLTGKCDAQKKMNAAFLWLAVAAIAVIAMVFAIRSASDVLKTSGFPATVAAGWSMQAVVMVIAAIVIAAAVVIAALAAADGLKYPSLKGQATGLIVGAGITTISAIMAAMPYGSPFSLGGGAAVISQMTSAGSSAMSASGK